MKACEFLDNASKHLIDRGKQYEAKEGERNMDRTVKAFNAITGLDLTTEQGWLFMVMLKAVRSQQGEFKADSFEDGAAYFALMGEQASLDVFSRKLKEAMKPVSKFFNCETCKDPIFQDTDDFHFHLRDDKEYCYHTNCCPYHEI